MEKSSQRKKRGIEAHIDGGTPKVRDFDERTLAAQDAQREAEELECEGDEDEFEDESVYDESSGNDWVDDDTDCEQLAQGSVADDGDSTAAGTPSSAAPAASSSASASAFAATGTADTKKQPKKEAWLPGQQMADDEELDYDPRAYDMIHHFELGWSCLSFDIVPDGLGDNRSSYPHTIYLVAGTQADRRNKNSLFAVKLSDMYKTNKDGDEDMSSDSSSNESDEENDAEPRRKDDNAYRSDPPAMRYSSYCHDGTVNRVRVCPQIPRIVATWSDVGNVAIWDIQTLIDRLEKVTTDVTPIRTVKPTFTASPHRGEEGFAMGWDPTTVGQFLTGGMDGSIRLYNPVEGGWTVDKIPFKGHSASVEDVQWKSRGEGMSSVFVSGSADASLRVWDIRVANREPVAQVPGAHDGDVNVVAWCPTADDILLSGGDDGVVSCWDMRSIGGATAQIAKIAFHKQPISSVSWHPTDQAMFSSSSLDDTVAIWDMSVEPDTEGAPAGTNEGGAFPDQLMFLHCGQRHIAEASWHSQIPGVMVSTAEDGFHVFRAENI